MNHIKTQLVVLGSGPGGYAAAFRAADLGLQTVLVERFETLGGVCLNVGCIPSKALLHAAKLIDDVKDMLIHGIDFGKPKIDTKKLVAFKDGVVNKLTNGLATLAKQRKVQVVVGTGKFTGQHELTVEGQNSRKIQFEHAVIATGSEPVMLPFIPKDPRIMTSTGALQLRSPHNRLLVLGGGIIGCEMATVYQALGAKVNIVEFMDQLMPGTDKDLVQPLHKRLASQCESIRLKTKVTAVEAKKEGLFVTFEGAEAPSTPEKFDQILVSVGRKPNGKEIGVETYGVNVDDRGFIKVDNQMRTHVQHIYAIGDVVGQPMLAHKATAEGRLVAEIIAGKKYIFEPRCIPAVAYTDPEVAWTGVTETQAKQQSISYSKGTFPWAASGRALGMGRSEGMTKLLFDEKGRIIGGGIVGSSAGDLISEISLAIEMGCDAADIGLTIHPHPTLSETVMLAAEMFEGTITDLYMPKKQKKEE